MATQIVILKRLLAKKRKKEAEEQSKEDERQRRSPLSSMGAPPAGGWASESGKDMLLEDGDFRDDAEVVNHVYAAVQTQRDRKRHYCDLFFFLIFYIIYLTVLFLQQHSTTKYEVAVGHSVLIPRDVLSTPLTDMDSIDEVYEFLNTSLLSPLWAPPTCGDGACDVPEELPGFGDFGCTPDCGVAPTSDVRVQMRTDFQRPDDLAASSWNLCMLAPARFCWYEQDQSFEGLKSIVNVLFPLPDGDWELRVNAPNGGVSGSIISPAGVEGNMKSQGEYAVIATFGGCADPATSKLVACKGTCNQIATCAADGCTGLNNTNISQLYVACVSLCNLDNALMDPYFNTTCIQKLLGDPDRGLLPVMQSFNVTCPLDPLYLSNFTGAGQLAAQRSLLVAPLGTPHRVEAPRVGLPVNIRNATLNSTALDEPVEVVRAKYWERLGSTDAIRLNNLRFAVSRHVNTALGDNCLAGYNMGPRTTPSKMAPFLCAYLGGPPDLPGCQYLDPVTNQTLTSLNQTALKASLGARYGPGTSFNISQAEQDKFLDLLVGGLISTAGDGLTDAVVRDLDLRLKDLSPQIVSHPVHNYCTQVDVVQPWESGAHQAITVARRKSITWVWTDDEPHALLGGDEKTQALLVGFGTGTSVLSRYTQCTPLNLGSAEDWLNPNPCVLELASNRGNPQGVFAYTQVWDAPGVYNLSDARAGADMTASVKVVNYTAPAAPVEPGRAEFLCAPGCPLSLLLSGRCERFCDNVACAYDGGDCNCPNPAAIDIGNAAVGSASKLTTCNCPSGQTRDPNSACCEGAPVGYLEFKLNSTGQSVDVAQILSANPRIRLVARTNRVVGGMLLHQVRSKADTCPDSKFSDIKDSCASSSLATDPFGVDPVFLPTSSIYNSNLEGNATQFYADDQVTPAGVPFGFFHHPVPGLKAGYPLLFDINLDQLGVERRFAYMTDGIFLDNSTSSLLVRLVTYNGDAGCFTDFKLTFTFKPGGHLVIKSETDVVDVELYNSIEDWVRLALEIAVVVGIVANIVSELKEIRQTYKREGSVLRHYMSPWNFIDFASISCMIICAVLWVVYVTTLAQPFKTAIRYTVYEDLRARANYFKLAGDGSEFNTLMSNFYDLQKIITFKSIYLTINGINIFLMTLRVFKLLDFQPQLGIFTRTLALAWPELVNFFVLWLLIYFAYTCMGYLIFGRVLDKFSTLGQSAYTVFDIILGNSAVGAELFALPNAVDQFTGQLFFWSFEIFMVFIVMNFLIAIAVDAFVEIKQSTEASTSVLQDLVGYGNSYVRQATGRVLPDQRVARSLRKMGARVPLKGEEEGPARLERPSSFTDTEDTTDTERVTRHRVLKVNNKEVDLETLEAILLRNSNSGSLLGRNGHLAARQMAQQILHQYGEEVEVVQGRKKPLRRKTKKGPKVEDEVKDLKEEVRSVKDMIEDLQRTLTGVVE